MHCDILRGLLKQLCHLSLRQPHSLILQTDIHLCLSVLCLIYDDLIIRIHKQYSLTMHIHLRAIFERISLAYASLMLSPRYILKSSLTLTSRHLATSIRFSKLGWALLVHHLDTGRSRGQVSLRSTCNHGSGARCCPNNSRDMSPWVQSIHSSYSRAWAGSSASPPTKVPVLVQSIPIHSISKASVSGSIYVFFIINS